ncbi:hypothetical protein DS2_00800 [Catenovulum agarivorans DS-2]|uniref:Uncharacterized protein n=1 Tax=Catenovulum agarivorans DS-2 TaxID=1328313 RepID=W7R3M0_9ALTE|nr:c-type cytochrome biogenesis protein CcmI [Catenovulum agarivorans]EWH12215.1 hypothetical protein DS2_00800 [Catenovulum agarivorans DS-2]
MNELILVLVGFALIASTLVLLPWMAKQHNWKQDHQRIENLYAEKLQELAQDLQQGNIEEQAYKAAKEDLTVQLASELSQAKVTSGLHISKNTMWLLPVVTLIVTSAIYYIQGKPAQMEQWLAAQSKTAEFGQKLMQGNENFTKAELNEFYLGLRSKLAEQTPDASGWLLLGRVAYSLNNLSDAIAAFEQALKIDSEHYPSRMSLAQSLLASGDESMMKRAGRIYNQVLQQNPADAEALTMAGYTAFQLQNNQVAAQYWQLALNYLPEDDSRRKAIEQTLPQVSAHAAAAQQSAQPTADAKSVVIKFNVSQQTQAQVADFQYLVVFARPQLSGPPAAVLRLPIENGQLPDTVTLTDQNAMMQGFNLSSLANAYITVRLSKDADVGLSEGEIEKNSDALTLEQNTQVTMEL